VVVVSSWLRTLLTGTASGWSRPRPLQHYRRPYLEPLEGRTLLATIVQITNYSGANYLVGPPSISDEVVAWRATLPGGPAYPNLYLENLNTLTAAQVTNFAGTYALSDPAVSNGLVAYMADPPGATPLNVFVYNAASQATTQVTNFTTNPATVSANTPGISGNLVAWTGYPAGGSLNRQLFVYDLGTGVTTQITNFAGTYVLSDPAVSNGLVAYMADPPGGTPLNVFVYNAASRTTTQVTNFTANPAVVSANTPSISGKLVAWMGYPAGGSPYRQLFVHDLGTGVTTQVTSFAGTYALSDPAVSNGLVAYMADPPDATPLNVFVYDVSSRSTTQVTSYDFNPTVVSPSRAGISNGVVAWQADPPGATDRNVFVGDTIPLVVTDVADVSPDPRNAAVSNVDVSFSEPINLATFTFDDVALTRNGTPVTLTGTVTTSFVSGTTYRISGLTNPTTPEGSYALTVSATGIKDRSGFAGSGSTSDDWVMDTTRPVADITNVSPDPRTTPISSITLVFSEAVTGFDLTDVSLTRDGTSVSLAGASLTTADRVTWTLGNLSGLTGALGTYALTLTAAGSGIADAAGNPLAADASDSWAVVAPPAVQAIAVNDGAAQRSMVDSLAVTFSDVVTLAAGAFELRDAAGNLIPATITVTTQVVGGRTVATLTFSGTGVGGGSLADGRYTLTVRADKVTTAAGTMAADYAFAFYRLFGDGNGDGVVDVDDLLAFASAYGTGSGAPGYLWYFDSNGDGVIDLDDLLAFADRYGTGI
jgi:hypothetical protein